MKRWTKRQEQKKNPQPAAAGPCKICMDHYGSLTCLAPGEQGHGPAAPAVAQGE